MLFITLIIAVTGVVLGLYAAYIATIIPVLYAMNMCYQAKKEGRIRSFKFYTNFLVFFEKKVSNNF